MPHMPDLESISNCGSTLCLLVSKAKLFYIPILRTLKDFSLTHYETGVMAAGDMIIGITYYYLKGNSNCDRSCYCASSRLVQMNRI